MRMIEIAALDNGAHRNQTFHGVLPEGWAVIPNDMDTPNFPFGEITVEDVNGIPTVTSWIPGVMPEPEPEPEQPEEADNPTVWDELDAAYQEGVNGAYDQ